MRLLLSAVFYALRRRGSAPLYLDNAVFPETQDEDNTYGCLRAERADAASFTSGTYLPINTQMYTYISGLEASPEFGSDCNLSIIYLLMKEKRLAVRELVHLRLVKTTPHLE